MATTTVDRAPSTPKDWEWPGLHLGEQRPTPS